MFTKFTFIISFFIILFVHFTLFASQEKKVVEVVKLQPTVNKISLKKVVIKQKEQKKTTKKKEIKKPKEVVKKEIVKKANQKIAKLPKKVIEEKEKKHVKEDIPKLTPTAMNKIKPLPKKIEMVSENKKVLIENQYLTKLREIIEQNKIYPKTAKRLKQEGKVIVSFNISKNGDIKDIKLINGSSFKRLNHAAVELLEKLNKFEPIPKELKKEIWAIELPINYSIINI